MKILSLFLIVTGLTLGGCCDENFINPDYDFREYAIDISGRMFDGCLYEPEFTTEGATPDGEVPYCSNNRIQNRWFKFQFGDDVYFSAEVRSISIGGTQQATIVTLWDTDGITALDCNYYYGLDDDVFVSSSSLTIGNWYYISVDVAEAQYAGTFDICLFVD